MIVGVDTGGTFTDFIYLTEEGWRVLKLPSTPKDPSQAVIRGIEKIAKEKSIKRVIHGSTVATNTLLERKGALTALITNRGIEDVLEIQRQNRDRIYELCYRKPEPLVPRHLRFGIKGRVNAKGEVLEDIDPEEIEVICDKLKEEQVEAVAVSLLFCFLRPEQEEKVARIIKEKGLKVYTSSEILPVFREYERTSTVVINAYVAPKMEAYLKRLDNGLKTKTLHIMQSNGGVISVRQAGKEAVRTILSGPAGGVVAAKFLGKAIGEGNLITLDMGGTSTDVSLIHEGKERLTTEYKIAGLPVGVQVIEIHTIGAGGGSIARIDEGGALRVGPESAGADPGPVCYGKGKELTITDAHLYLGRLVPEHFLGGNMKLYPEKVAPYMEKLALKAGLSPLQLAEGIVKVANSNMEAAIRVVSVEKGYDPREHSLLVFGGAGALHGAELALSMGIPKVIVPRHPGIFSALGMLVADVVKDYSLTVMLEEPEAEAVEAAFHQLEARAREEMEKEGFLQFQTLRVLHCRFKGQSYEVEVPFSKEYRKAFTEAYRRLYGIAPEDRPIEVVNISLRAVGHTEKPTLNPIPEATSETPSEALLGYKKVFHSGSWKEAKVFERERLLAGHKIEGPAIVVEYSSTTFIPPEYTATVDTYGNLVLEVHGG